MPEIIRISLDKGWLPDMIPFGLPEGGLSVAKNVLPYSERYAPARAGANYSTSAFTAGQRILNAQEFRDSGGSSYTFFGSNNKLWRMNGSGALTDITRLAGAYTGLNGRWSFAKYGEWIIATNFQDAIQLLSSMTAANFADMTMTGAPASFRAKDVLLHKGHLISSHLSEAGTVYNQRVRWSARDNVNLYTSSLTTGAGSQDLYDADGENTGMANVGNVFAILHRNSVTLGYYVGGSLTFNFESNMIRNIGCVSAGSVISIGPAMFFWGEKEIYAMTADGSVEAIGRGVGKTLYDSLNTSNYDRITAAHDPFNKLVYWAFPSTGNDIGYADTIAVFNYEAKRWTYIDIDASCVFTWHTGALDMDTGVQGMYADMDSIPGIYHMDSEFWKANSFKMMMVEPTTLYVQTMSGAALTGVIESGELKIDDNVIQIQRVRPRVSLATAAVSARIGSRFEESDAVTYSASATVGNNGYADVRQSGRYNRVEITATEHSGIQDIEVGVVKAGMR